MHTQLPSGIHVFERGWLSANNILFATGRSTALVDSGYCTHSTQTVALVSSILGERSLDLLINTHLHSDHCGGNAALQRHYPEIETRVPPGQARFLSPWDPVALTYEPTGQQCPRFEFSGVLRPGETVQLGESHWEIRAAPGHDPHSIILFEPNLRVLMSADALWERGFGVVFPELDGVDAFAEVAATLDLIEQLKPETIIPGHGRVFAYAPAVAAYARRRLESFSADPLRHANHAAKVLLKFKLLEEQRIPIDGLKQWAEHTAYFAQIKNRFFASLPMQVWLTQLCDELVAAKAALVDADYILNS